MMHKWNIIASGRVEIGGDFYGETLGEAQAAAQLELRQGEVSDVSFERCVLIDDDGYEAELDQSIQLSEHP